MKGLSKGIVKIRYLILIVSLALLLPSLAGMLATRINYDILTYLPSEIETMQGQDILLDEFGTGAFSMFIAEGMAPKDVEKIKENIEQVDGVKSVLWYDSFLDVTIPMEMLPDKVYNAFNNGDATMLLIIFEEGTSADRTLAAVDQIRAVSNKQCFLSGMSAITEDTKLLAEKETPLYVLIAVVLAVIVLSLTMDSFLIPLFFLLNIGMAILYNLGSNIFLHEISFVTQALAAVLQLGVTMDYSIFLWHSYQEELEKTSDKKEAMAEAISLTFQSVLGSSITTVAGFAALCFMSFRIGLDLGIVMMKGVVLGVISCVTVLPSMILIFDKWLEKTRHKPLMKEFNKLPKFIAKHYLIIGILFLCILPFAIYGNNHTEVYYNLSDTLPEKLESVQANHELSDHFKTNTMYLIMADASLDAPTTAKMVKELEKVDGVDSVLGIDAVAGTAIPRDFLPSKLTEMLQNDHYKLMFVASNYTVASDAINEQIDAINTIIKGYDNTAMVIGEAPCTKDLITITNHDFNVVNWVSIGFVFAIIFFVLKSVSLPVILVAVIEFAIFINMGIPYYTHTKLPFIASVVIGTIQLGSTVDYAILMTTRYCRERTDGHSRTESTQIALTTSMKSIIVSALSFFAATFGVGLISSIDMIGSLCSLMARGALISMAVVLLVLPAMYMIFDPLIKVTTLGFGPAREADHRRKMDKHAKAGA